MDIADPFYKVIGVDLETDLPPENTGKNMALSKIWQKYSYGSYTAPGSQILSHYE